MILVVGATGRLGGAITLALLAQGRSVRILLRENSPSARLAPQGMATAAETLIAAGAQPASGDLKDRASLDAACAGVETVLTTATSALRGGEDNFDSVDRRGLQSLIDAAVAAGVRRFIFISAARSDPNHPHPLFRAKGQTEAALRASGLDYTILKPGVFMETWLGAVIGAPLRAGQPVTLVGEGKTKIAFVSAADVLAYAVAAVDHPAARNAEIWIGGPAPASYSEAVEAAGRALGRLLPVRTVPPGEPLPLLPETMAQLLTSMETGPDQFIDMSQTAAVFGIEPTSLETFAARFFGGG
jgi:NADH dehydrogenase